MGLLPLRVQSTLALDALLGIDDAVGAGPSVNVFDNSLLALKLASRLAAIACSSERASSYAALGGRHGLVYCAVNA